MGAIDELDDRLHADDAVGDKVVGPDLGAIDLIQQKAGGERGLGFHLTGEIRETLRIGLAQNDRRSPI